MQLQEKTLLQFLRLHIRRVDLGQVIMAICIAGLSVWCAMNVVSIMDKYYLHETIISLQNDPPHRTGFPGITICAPSIFTTHKLAEMYPDFRKILRNFTREVKSAKSVEMADGIISKNSQDRNDKLRYFESIAMQTINASIIINELSVRPDDLLEDCMYFPINIRSFQMAQEDPYHRANMMKCSDMKLVLETIYEGRKCFTYFSDLLDLKKVQGDNSKETLLPNEGQCVPPHYCQPESSHFLRDSRDQMVFDLNPSIEVRLKSIENDVWSAFTSDPVLMTVHPPNILQNRRDFLFFQVTRSNFYEILFTKKSTQLLPPPHKTMCVKYRETDKYQAEHIKTRDQCISVCINSYLPVSAKKCANYYSVLTESMFYKEHAGQRICNHNNQNYNDYLDARAYCEQQCPAECIKNIYEITGQIRNTLEDNCHRWYQQASDDDMSIGNVDMYDLSKNADDLALSDADKLDPLFGVAELVQFDKLAKVATPYLSLRKFGNSLASLKKEDTTNGSDVSYSSDETWQQNCNARVSIRISPKPFTTVRHQPAITYEGFLGTIGGHIGIWLGLSLYKIIKFAVHILYNLLYRMVSKYSPKFAQPADEVCPTSAY